MTLEIKLVLEFQQPTITCNLIYSSNTTTVIRIHHNEWVMIVDCTTRLLNLDMVMPILLLRVELCTQLFYAIIPTLFLCIFAHSLFFFF